MTWRWSGTKGMDLHEALRAAYDILQRKVGSYLEIGVDGGGSLNTVLCEGVPNRIVLCDLWDPRYCDHGDTKPRVLEILHYFRTTAVFLDGDSKKTVPMLREWFDLVLVDGDHSAEAAKIDLNNAWPLVKKGGILIMDDINHPDYPWLGQVWEDCVQSWECSCGTKKYLDRIPEERGGCNAAMVIKR